VTESGTEISIHYWIHSQNVVAIWVVEVSLISDVVEVRQIFGKASFVLSLFQDVLAFVPIPRLVNFSKILHYQGVTLDTVWSVAEDSETFRVDSEVGVNLVFELADSI